MLERFRGHPHLVTLLMSWTLKGEYYFLFPFAESDLDHYWGLDTNWNAVRSPDPDCRYETIRWISKQIHMMVGALAHIHNLDETLSVDKRFGRHGDLKPENVLWYRSPNDPKGFFVIADLGLAACNSERSRSEIPSHTIARTPNYRSPECDLEDGKISRSYDIWTMGCLLLEMVCWILGGPKSRDEFAQERTSTYVSGSQSDIFFDVEENEDRTGHVMFVKKSVEQVRLMKDTQIYQAHRLTRS
jgi:serine/threonine protein kinase